MNYIVEDVTFPSSNGRSVCAGKIYIPEGKEIKGVVQISHGMVDHVGRYGELVRALTDNGYVVAGNDHLGHGMTAKGSGDEFGYFGEAGGRYHVVDDLRTMNSILFERFGMKPCLFGHSMGSFLARLYAVRYADTISSLVIHGTGGPMGAILPLGKGVVKLIMLFCGRTHRSMFVKKLAFSGYNSHYPKEEGASAWLTRDLSMVADRSEDEFTSFIFTVSAYLELFEMLGESNSKNWFVKFPKELRTLIMSGDDDPVGAYGKGPEYIYAKLSEAGTRDLSFKLYPGARHELFNETNREEVFSDLISWLNGASV